MYDSNYATGARLPRGNPALIASTATKPGNGWPRPMRVLYARIAKAKAPVTINQLNPKRNKVVRWRIRCLLKAHTIRLAA